MRDSLCFGVPVAAFVKPIFSHGWEENAIVLKYNGLAAVGRS